MSNSIGEPLGFAYRPSIEYSRTRVGYLVVALRLLLGWVLLYSGITKVLDPTWTAAGYLEHAVPAGNPFPGVWTFFAGVPAIDLLVQWGMLLTGLGLVLGAFVRWNAFWATVMMLTFWASSLPLEHAVVVDQHVVYAAVFVGLAALNAGKVVGVDAYLARTETVENSTVLRRLVG